MNYNEFLNVSQRAHSAGMAALAAVVPEPMIVNQVEGGAAVKSWYVSEGACGFAWIKFPGNCAFGRHAKKVGLARPAYPSGLSIWVGEGGQSVDRKYAYAAAYAEVLRSAGVKAFAGSRLD